MAYTFADTTAMVRRLKNGSSSVGVPRSAWRGRISVSMPDRVSLCPVRNVQELSTECFFKMTRSRKWRWLENMAVLRWSRSATVVLHRWQSDCARESRQVFSSNDDLWQFVQLLNLILPGLCTDLTNGVLTNGNQVQTWQCTKFNNNQVWNVWGWICGLCLHSLWNGRSTSRVDFGLSDW